jgi:polyhydroxybutyrate depolymerase
MAAQRLVPALLAVLLLGACTPASAPSAGTTAPGPTTMSLRGRDFQLVVPPGYDPQRPTGLVLGLHGYTSNAADLDSYFGLSAEAARRGLLVALPEGTKNSGGDQFWNATSACCDFDSSGVDDSGYLSSLIELVTQSYSVDPSRVFVVGHSNGGFMALRLACEHADLVAGIISLAGAQNLDESACRPSRPVSVLQVHGTQDETISFGGSGGYPSAQKTIRQWADLDRCSGKTAGDPRDLDVAGGAETRVTAWTSCRGGAGVELWAIEDGGHVPALADDFAQQVLDWLEAHAR